MRRKLQFLLAFILTIIVTGLTTHILTVNSVQTAGLNGGSSKSWGFSFFRKVTDDEVVPLKIRLLELESDIRQLVNDGDIEKKIKTVQAKSGQIIKLTNSLINRYPKKTQSIKTNLGALQSELNQLLASIKDVTELKSGSKKFNHIINKLSNDTREVFTIMVENDFKAQQIKTVSNMFVAVERISSNLRSLEAINENTTDLAVFTNKVSSDLKLFQDNLNRLLNGDPQQKIAKVDSADVKPYLAKINSNFTALHNGVVPQLKKSTLVSKTLEKIKSIRKINIRLQNSLLALLG